MLPPCGFGILDGHRGASEGVPTPDAAHPLHFGTHPSLGLYHGEQSDEEMIAKYGSVDSALAHIRKTQVPTESKNKKKQKAHRPFHSTCVKIPLPFRKRHSFFFLFFALSHPLHSLNI